MKPNLKSIAALSALILLPSCNQTNPKDKLTTVDLIEEILNGKRTSAELSERDKKRLKYYSFHLSQQIDTDSILEDALREQDLRKMESDPEIGPYAKALRPTLAFRYYEFPTKPVTTYYLPFSPLEKSRVLNLKLIWEEYLKDPKNENITIEIKPNQVQLTLVKTVDLLGRQVKDTSLTVYIDKDQLKNLPHYSETQKKPEANSIK